MILLSCSSEEFSELILRSTLNTNVRPTNHAIVAAIISRSGDSDDFSVCVYFGDDYEDVEVCNNREHVKEKQQPVVFL